MALEPIDTKTLMLKDGTLATLRAHFESLKGEIDNTRRPFGELDCDLGMQECAEGRSWDKLVNDISLNKVHHSLTKLIERAEEFQGRLTDIENAYDKTEQRNAANFKGLSRDTGWPATDAK